MKTQEQLEIERLALSSELARQIGHDCSNFVYCTILKLELWEAASSIPTAIERLNLKQEAKKLAVRLQQWQDFHGDIETKEQRVDLNRLVDEVGIELRERNQYLDIAIAHADTPMWIMGDPVGFDHLLQLVTMDLLTGNSRGSRIPVSIQTNSVDSWAMITIAAGMSKRDVTRCEIVAPEEQAASLLQSACKSLAIRLDAKLLRGRDADGQLAVQIDIPMSPP